MSSQMGVAECLTQLPADALGKPVLQTHSRMWVDDIQAECKILAYSTPDPKVEIIAVVKGDIAGQEGVPARVHSECFTGDVLASKRCDCGQQLHKFMRVMNDVPFAVLLYVKGQEGRGIGLTAKIRAYQLQDEGHDTVDANLKLGLPVDIRTYGDTLFVLRDLGIKSVRLYTNNPDKMSALQSITQEVVAMPSVVNERNIGYLKTKKDRLNHRTVLETFKLPELSLPPSQLRIGIVYAMWNQYFVDELRSAAEAELERCRVEVLKMAVPGALELVSGARITLRHHKPDAIIVIGVLIKGSSDLYDRSCNAVMTGLTELNAIQDTPIILGLLMCQNEDRASPSSGATTDEARGAFGSHGDQWAPLVGWSNLLTVLVILTMSLLQVLKREVAPLCTLGVILANFITKGLKILVKCLDSTGTLWRRPSNSRRAPEDPGFPSSHTSIMTFISVYFALYLWLHLGYPFFRAALVAVLPSGFMAAARIRDQDHTLQQTIGGVLWGTCMGLWWALIGPRLRGILEWAEPQPWALVVLCFAVGLPIFTKPLVLRPRKRP
ncbi:4-dihydroxy-2-butanone 4-phosphate synthase (DHBP synthase) [Durusdinium trenchii]|uniref:4-dihydroxy-2-butanone 4-phosphate synthase (DHBP synthase) n=2 Tax=Durusdinium trenchii TaxID=1381693 RepID=A0ABP0LA90_9DINO